MLRSPLLTLAVAALWAGACSHDGTYEIAWGFDPTAAGMVTETAAAGCGAHGVHAVRVTGKSEDGTTSDAVARCTPGLFAHNVPPGKWTLTVHAVDAQDRLLDDTGGVNLNPTVAELNIAEGEKLSAMVAFVPLPSCEDGVDNDGDGRVDLDDPDCSCMSAAGTRAEESNPTWMPCPSP